MTELAEIIEWIGMGMVGFLILIVIIMLWGLFTVRDRDPWE